MGNAKPEPSGYELARLRIAAGLSARQLAEQAGISHSIVSRAERGQRMRHDNAEALVKVLGPAVRDAVWPLPPDATALALARRATGETRNQAAKRAGVKFDTFARAERGERVHPATAKKIADAFGLDVLDVLPFPFDEGQAA